MKHTFKLQSYSLDLKSWSYRPINQSIPTVQDGGSGLEVVSAPGRVEGRVELKGGVLPVHWSREDGVACNNTFDG